MGIGRVGGQIRRCFRLNWYVRPSVSSAQTPFIHFLFVLASQGGGQEATVIDSLSTLTHHGINYVPFGYATAFKQLTNLDEPHGGEYCSFLGAFSMLLFSLFHCACRAFVTLAIFDFIVLVPALLLFFLLAHTDATSPLV